MPRSPRFLPAALVVSLLLGTFPPAGAAGGGSVTGVLLDPYGRPAQGHALVLLDGDGKEVARGVANASGHYAVEGVPKGTYSLLVEGPGGARAVVAAPPLVMKGGRQNLSLRLLDQGDEPASAVPTSTAGWWKGLPTSGKVWVVLGGVALTAFAVAGLDDDAETPASPFQ